MFAIKGKGGDGIPYVSPPTKVPIRDNKKITCWLYTCLLYTSTTSAGRSKSR